MSPRTATLLVLILTSACQSAMPLALTGGEQSRPPPTFPAPCADARVVDLVGGTPIRAVVKGDRWVLATVGAVWEGRDPTAWEELRVVGRANGDLVDLVDLDGRILAIASSGHLLEVTPSGLVAAGRLSAQPTAVRAEGGRLWWVSRAAGQVGWWSAGEARHVAVDGWPSDLAPLRAGAVVVAAGHGGVMVVEDGPSGLSWRRLTAGGVAAPELVAARGGVIVAARRKFETLVDVWVDGDVQSVEIGDPARAIAADGDELRVWTTKALHTLHVREQGPVNDDVVPLEALDYPGTRIRRDHSDRVTLAGHAVGRLQEGRWVEELRSGGEIVDLVAHQDALLVAIHDGPGGSVLRLDADLRVAARTALGAPPGSLQLAGDGLWIRRLDGSVERRDPVSLEATGGLSSEEPIYAAHRTSDSIWGRTSAGLVRWSGLEAGDELQRRVVRPRAGDPRPVGEHSGGMVSIDNNDGLVSVYPPGGAGDPVTFRLSHPPRTRSRIERMEPRAIRAPAARSQIHGHELWVPQPISGFERLNLRTGSRRRTPLLPGAVDAVGVGADVAVVRGEHGLAVLPADADGAVRTCGLPGDSRRVVRWQDRLWVASDGMLIEAPAHPQPAR